MLHPEGGHIYLKRHPDDINTKDTYTEEKNHKNKKPMDNNIKDNNTKDDNTHYNNPKDNYPADYNPEDNKPKNNNSTNYNPMDNSTGYCHYHRDCLEDLAAGPAIEIRWGSRAELLKDNKEVWELESYYLAQALVDYIMILSPEIIILGGGVMKQEQLFPLIREKVKELVGGYIRTEQMDNLDNYIVPAGLNGDQGIIGCLQLAKTAVQ
jgi:hypothetical protein